MVVAVVVSSGDFRGPRGFRWFRGFRELGVKSFVKLQSGV